MFERTRSLWVSTAALGYVAFAAAQSREGPAWTWLLVPALPLAWFELWRRTKRRARGEALVSPVAMSAFRAVAWGTLLWVASRVGPSGSVGFDALGNLGCGFASVAGLVALARIRSPGGMLRPPRAAQSLDAAAFAGLIWGVATSLPAALAALPSAAVRLEPLMIDYATTAASLGTLLLLIATTWRLRWLRGLELGVGDRAAAGLALSATAGLVAIPAAFLDLGPPDRLLPSTVLVASLMAAGTVVAREPTRVSGAVRGILAIMVLGAPITLVSSILARAMPNLAAMVVLASSVLAIAVGIAARAAARPLAPEQSRWLDAIDSASRGALQPEPDSAIRAALEALRATGTAPGARPELWRFVPPQVLSVDVAGYLHVTAADPPASLTELALAEPERTVRAEALNAVQVRQPEVRPLLEWFRARNAFSATLVLDEDGPSGFLLMPRGKRTSSLSLEEARAMRILTDRISALLAVSSALARSRDRELEATERITSLAAERDHLTSVVAGIGGRHVADAERKARRVKATSYCPAARMALESIRKAARSAQPLALEVPNGCDAIGWAAFAHVEGTRPEGPLVVVCGTGSAEQSTAYWDDSATSPWRLAEGGTLVVTDVGALPAGIQSALAASANRRDPRPSPLGPPWLLVTSGRSYGDLERHGSLSAPLARATRDRVIRTPSLAERAEDLRALLLDAATRSGLRTKGAPLGIDPGALRWLVEHPWPANELELDALMLRAALSCAGGAITAADLEGLGFCPLETTAALAPALPEDRSVRRATLRRRRPG